jgi:hypothetical protein
MTKPYGIWLERTTPGGEPVGSWATIYFGGRLARYATMAEAEEAAGRFRDKGHNATAKPFGNMEEDEAR